MFEEEYGQVDVESAIAAFEKAHPGVRIRRGDGAGHRIRSRRRRAGPASRRMPEPAPAAEWLREDRESAAPPPPPAPAPFWVPRAPEPELAPDPVRRRRLGRPAFVRRRRREPARRRSAHAADPARRGVRGARTHDGSAGRPRYGSDRAPRPGGADGGDRSCRDALDPSRRPGRPTAPGSRRKSRSWRRTRRSGSSRRCCPRFRGPRAGFPTTRSTGSPRASSSGSRSGSCARSPGKSIPDVAEIVIKQRIRELESGVE